jgi:hypothetical protein
MNRAEVLILILEIFEAATVENYSEDGSCSTYIDTYRLADIIQHRLEMARLEDD